MIDLYTDASPNGFKITIALEELDLAYQTHHVKIENADNRTLEFLELNPHGRIPVIVDNDAGITLFESAAILLYLAKKAGRLLPVDSGDRWKAIQWLQFHASSVGPILGQRVHFEMFAPQSFPAAIERYQVLTEEAFSTLDRHLSRNQWFAGDEYSIADIANFGWTHIAMICGFDLSNFSNLSAWHYRVAERDAVKRGVLIPVPATGP
ncbi:glutathione S-transferase N-terminal domain-containing protein [Brucella sp. NBRC 12950]|uniref:glutathione S-transferase family protein n=1 Tax=Brucella sp. NBRC 12950 TaxID=2994518 RepID=UPI0024A502DA|nr:glutathione S-transferase N-terminal domain-containing protein [Brucella sp. NBRC 12950]GLU27490.1 glutathione S-transferase [Brucella sp. NBRC 12950]